MDEESLEVLETILHLSCSFHSHDVQTMGLAFQMGSHYLDFDLFIFLILHLVFKQVSKSFKIEEEQFLAIMVH